MKKLICIAGTSYCGSTIISMIMDCLPNVTALGEVNTIKNFDLELAGREYICYGCFSKDCPIFNNNFLWEDGNIYLKCLDKIEDGQSLIISDKNPSVIRENMPETDAEIKIIVLYKRAEAGLKSIISHAEMPLQTAINLYCYIYDDAVALYKQYGGVILNYEDFVKHPSEQLQGVCKELGLEYDETALQYWKQQHHMIGGNNGAYISLYGDENIDKIGVPKDRLYESYGYDEDFYEGNYHKISLDETWKDFFTPKQLKKIQTNDRLKRLEKKLQSLM